MTNRILVSEQLPEINLFKTSLRRAESLVITFYEASKDFTHKIISNSEDLVNCISNPQEFILNFYRNKINVPEKDAATGLPINKEEFINAEINKLQIPDYLKLTELSKDILILIERLNVTLNQLIKKTDALETMNLFNKERIEAIIDGRFRVYANSEEEKSFIKCYRELIDRANRLQSIYFKNTGGFLMLPELLKIDGHEFKIREATWEQFKKDSSLIKQ